MTLISLLRLTLSVLQGIKISSYITPVPSKISFNHYNSTVNLWEPASHRSGWFGRFRLLTKGGSPPSLNFESCCIKRCASLTPRLLSRADVSLDSSAEPLARLSRSACEPFFKMADTSLFAQHQIRTFLIHPY